MCSELQRQVTSGDESFSHSIRQSHTCGTLWMCLSYVTGCDWKVLWCVINNGLGKLTVSKIIRIDWWNLFLLRPIVTRFKFSILEKEFLYELAEVRFPEISAWFHVVILETYRYKRHACNWGRARYFHVTVSATGALLHRRDELQTGSVGAAFSYSYSSRWVTPAPRHPQHRAFTQHHCTIQCPYTAKILSTITRRRQQLRFITNRTHITITTTCNTCTSTKVSPFLPNTLFNVLVCLLWSHNLGLAAANIVWPVGCDAVQIGWGLRYQTARCHIP